ncbi:hypothetical protein DSLASN_17240 [Desulfoluna limicola]|uniref:Uncharacterized protein n=1 Tax=Desulfoluna limicola TaxID=2810562 RepID=A0ABN6F3L6_9BACT|nr:hypothetical protein DSLASN_17240 [Desulfoluna limicola]
MSLATWAHEFFRLRGIVFQVAGILGMRSSFQVLSAWLWSRLAPAFKKGHGRSEFIQRRTKNEASGTSLITPMAVFL